MQWDQGEPWVEPDRPKNGPLGKGTSNNTLSLPRDLSVGYNGTGSSRFVKQAFIPELKTLRRGHTELAAQSLPTGGAGEPQWLPAAAGAQIEIFATFQVSASAVDRLQAADRHDGTVAALFGLVVLASNASVGVSGGSDTAVAAERTVIAFDLSRKMVQLDRRLSGASLDADVRAGPWPDGSNGTEVTVHAFIDHAVVSLIAGNQTAISAWVAPQRADSVGVGVFSELGLGEVTATVDVWQLATPTHS
jgi:hypothetical protein